MTTTQPPFDYLSENIFEAFCENVLEGVYEIASMKQIVLADADAERLADVIADALDLPEPLLFMRDDAVARDIVRDRICTALDLHMAEAFADLYVATFGGPPRPSARVHMRRLMRHLLPQTSGSALVSWPPLTVASLTPHLETRCDQLVTVWLDGTTTTYSRGFLLDRPSGDGAALHMHHNDGHQESEFWTNGVLHRDPAEGAALITSRDERIEFEEYYDNGQLHRDGAPATINYACVAGRVLFCAYYQHGVIHRTDGAACLMFEDTGRTVGEYWYRDGLLHRDGAPAIIERDADGAIILEVYWQNGERCTVTVDTYGVANA